MIVAVPYYNQRCQPTNEIPQYYPACVSLHSRLHPAETRLRAGDRDRVAPTVRALRWWSGWPTYSGNGKNAVFRGLRCVGREFPLPGLARRGQSWLRRARLARIHSRWAVAEAACGTRSHAQLKRARVPCRLRCQCRNPMPRMVQFRRTSYCTYVPPRAAWRIEQWRQDYFSPSDSTHPCS